MPKGLLNLYNDICHEFVGEDFVEWKFDNPATFTPGMICETVIWYVKRKRWYLTEDKYDPRDESKSTWFANEFTGSFPHMAMHNVMKFFEVEIDERLITTNSKKRPVILLRKSVDTWWNPRNTMFHTHNWLCVPIFTYKGRHPQEYVITDQRLKEPDRFYIPSYYSDMPGILNESAARYQSLQMVKEEHLSPIKVMCTTRSPNMERPITLSKIGLELVLYHFYKHLGVFEELDELETKYDIFKEEVNKRIDEAEKV